jgi:hypothetical protein
MRRLPALTARQALPGPTLAGGAGRRRCRSSVRLRTVPAEITGNAGALRLQRAARAITGECPGVLSSYLS